MKTTEWKFYVAGIAAFLLALSTGGFFLGNLMHESSHAIACFLFGLPYSLSWGQVVYAESPNPSVNIFVRLAGGMGQALFSLLFFWFVTNLEKKVLLQNVLNLRRLLDLSILFGFELAFLTLAFHGVITGIVEGFLYQNYVQTYDNLLLWGTIVLLCGITSFYILYRHQSQFLK